MTTSLMHEASPASLDEATRLAVDAPNQFVDVGNQRRLAYRSIGTGKPIVLCVRFRGNMDAWDPAFLGALVLEGFRVITFDYTALGLSEGGTPRYSPASLADDAHDLIQALQLKDAVIAGWSLGGMAAQVFVARHGSTVSHAVLIGTTPPGPNVKGAEQLFYDTALKPVNDLDDEVVLFFEPRSTESRVAAAASHERIKRRTAGLSNPIPLEFAAPALGDRPRSPLFPAPPVLEALKNTSLPILHLGADHDIIFPVENWNAISATLPTLRLHTFPQSGHGPHHQYPVEAARTIAAFVFAGDTAPDQSQALTETDHSMTNKELVKAAMTALFVDRDLSALEKYWDANYIQHNPRMPSGLDFFRKMIPSLGAGFQYEPGLILEDGEFVMIHGRYTGWGDKTMIGTDIFRVRNGRLVEHWDVIQEEVPTAQTLSGTPMFPITQSAPEILNRRHIQWESALG